MKNYVLRISCILAMCSCSESSELPEGCDVLVAPSEDDQTTVQTALLSVSDGQTLCLAEGTYSFTSELSLAVDNVTVRGEGQAQTILDFSEQVVGANGVTITAAGVTLQSFQVRYTPGDGIRATAANDVVFRDMRVHWDPPPVGNENGAYGLYPVGCTRVTIEDSSVTGARDAGIYVGQSSDIVVRNNEVYGNVAGIEIENSTDAEVYGNNVHENVGGIFVFNLPDLPVQDGKRTWVHDNTIASNNRDNFAEAGTTVAGVPSGVGVFVIAADDNEVSANTISDHISTAVLVLSYTEIAFEPTTDPNYDIYSERNYIHHNTFSGNGTDPQDPLSTFAQAPAPDVITDGCGGTNFCLFENSTSSYLNVDICGGFVNRTTDIGPVTCEGNPVGPRER